MGVTPAIEGHRLHRFFHTDDDEVLALQGVSIVAERGELVALRGPSASGKSTLLACLAGLDEPDAGMVRIDGSPMTRRSEAERASLRARSVGVLLQSRNLVGHLSVRQNVHLAQRLAGRPASADGLLEQLGLAARSDSAPTQLSGGEAARAGLAVALANDPLVLLADEPTAEIDEGTATEILWLLRAHADGGRSVIVATHSDVVAGIADRVVELSDGRVVA
jgi:putative ABC transport system ATP-binding protein